MTTTNTKAILVGILVNQNFIVMSAIESTVQFYFYKFQYWDNKPDIDTKELCEILAKYYFCKAIGSDSKEVKQLFYSVVMPLIELRTRIMQAPC